MRPEVASEKKFHKRIVEADTVRGGLKGLTVGTAMGSALRHLGHAGKHAPLTGAALGAAAGTISGYHHGKERELRDSVQQERLNQRAEARVKKAMWAGFCSELEKQANPAAAAAGGFFRGASGVAGNILGQVGRGVAGLGLRSGSTRGATSAAMGGLRSVAGENAHKVLGAGVLGAGALGAAAVGRATAPQPQGY